MRALLTESGDTIQINSEKVFCRRLPRRMTWCWQLGTMTRASLAMIESYYHAAAWQRKLICMVSPDLSPDLFRNLICMVSPDFPVWCPQISGSVSPAGPSNADSAPRGRNLICMVSPDFFICLSPFVSKTFRVHVSYFASILRHPRCGTAVSP